jgi:toxin-antitoxin system PIN domain toxin
MRKPLSPPQAVEFIDGWLAQPYVAIIVPGDQHWEILKNLLLSGGTAGNLTTDAHLAAMAIEHGCELASADNDFRRFSGIKLVNPLMKD